jgi:hypothetical protein
MKQKASAIRINFLLNIVWRSAFQQADQPPATSIIDGRHFAPRRWFQRTVMVLFNVPSFSTPQCLQELGSGHRYAYMNGVGGRHEKKIFESGW